MNHGPTTIATSQNEASANSSSTNYQTMKEGEGAATEIQSTPAPAGESHTRSLLKGITWRFLATMTTVVIAWIVIGEAGIAFQIGFFEVFAKIAIYYLHERIWAKIPV